MFPSFLRAVYTDSLDHDAKNEKGLNQKFDHPAWSGLSSTPPWQVSKLQNTSYIQQRMLSHLPCLVWSGQTHVGLPPRCGSFEHNNRNRGEEVGLVQLQMNSGAVVCGENVF